MNAQNLDSFHVIGVKINTTNENMQSSKDLPALWDKFINEKIADKIPGKIGNEIYCVYTDYEGDDTQPYAAIVGCKVSDVSSLPAGLESVTISKGVYQKFNVKGDLMSDIIWKAWGDIHHKGLPRTYATDFEVYGEKAQNPKDGELEIFVGVN